MLFGFGIFFLFGVISLIVFFFGKCRHKPNSSDVPTSQPLLENCNSSGATGYTGLHPIQLKEIRAHGKFGSVWRVSLHCFICILVVGPTVRAFIDKPNFCCLNDNNYTNGTVGM